MKRKKAKSQPFMKDYQEMMKMLEQAAHLRIQSVTKIRSHSSRKTP